MTLITDSELIMKAKAGDSGAFAELVRRYQSAIYGYCYYRTANFEDARDLCQDIFVMAYRKLDQLRDLERFGGWLKKIAANLCTKWSKRPAEFPLDEVVEAEHPSPNDSFRTLVVRQALADLPNNERLAIVMHYVDGLSYTEIADFLEVKPTTVKGRLYKGRERLKKGILAMTKQEFEDNKLDEKSLIESIHVALEDVVNTYYIQEDPQGSLVKFNKLESEMENLKSDSPEVWKARLHVLMNKDRVIGADLEERWVRNKEILQAAEKSGEYTIFSQQLATTASWAFERGEKKYSEELMERAYKIARQHNDSRALSWCDLLAGNIALQSRDLKKAETLIARSLATAKLLDTSRALHISWLDAHVRALQSLNREHAGDNLLYFSCQSGSFQILEDGPVYYGINPEEHVFEDFQGNRRLVTMMPTFKHGWPDRFIVHPVEPGREWTSKVVNGVTGQPSLALNTRIEDCDCTIAIKSGTYHHCLKTVSWMLGLAPGDKRYKEPQPIKTIIWFAPGIGIVKSIHEPLVGDIVTSEMVEHHIAGGEGYLPIEIGNRWRYRWVEGEEELGYKTQDYIEIVGPDHEEDGYLVIRYVTCTASK